MHLLESLRRNSTLHLTNYLVFAYTLFLLGFFVIPNAVDQYKFFIGAVFLPGLFAAKRVFQTLDHIRLWQLSLLYLLYMLITSFWSAEFSVKELAYTLLLTAYLIMFLLISVLIFQHDRTLFQTILKFVAISAAVAAVVSIALWYAEHPFPSSRLVGIGTIENPNPSAFVYGFFAVISCYYAFRSRGLRARLGFALVCAILLVFVVLTQSNTGILATALAVTLVFVFHKHHNPVILIAGLAGVSLAGLYLLSSLGMLYDPADSGILERLPIWQTVLEQSGRAPIFGNGYQKELLLTDSGTADIANYAHNAFLATARDGGLVGLSLQLLMLLAALHGALRIAQAEGEPIYAILLMFALICMLADTDQLITRPRELWVIFWLPLAIILAHGTKPTEKTPCD